MLLRNEYERYKDLLGLNLQYSHTAGPSHNYSELIPSPSHNYSELIPSLSQTQKNNFLF